MPFYPYRCAKCGFEKQKLLSPDKAKSYSEVCPSCKEDVLKYGLGTPQALGKETKDEYRNKSVEQDLGEKLLERSNEHFRKHELPRIIEKEGKAFAIEQGFITEEGIPKK